MRPTTPPLTLKTISEAMPSAELQKLVPAYRATDWKFHSDDYSAPPPEDYYGQKFSDVFVSISSSREIYRELVVDLGSEGKRDLRVRALLLDSIPTFDDLKTFETTEEFEKAFRKSETGSVEKIAYESWSSVRYWGGFVIHGDKMRVVFVTASLGREGAEDEWTIFERTIRESEYVAER